MILNPRALLDAVQNTFQSYCKNLNEGETILFGKGAPPILRKRGQGCENLETHRESRSHSSSIWHAVFSMGRTRCPALIGTYARFQPPYSRKDVFGAPASVEPHEALRIQFKSFVRCASGTDAENSTTAPQGLFLWTI